jgi:hypothetical protein
MMLAVRTFLQSHERIKHNFKPICVVNMYIYIFVCIKNKYLCHSSWNLLESAYGVQHKSHMCCLAVVNVNRYHYFNNEFLVLHLW